MRVVILGIVKVFVSLLVAALLLVALVVLQHVDPVQVRTGEPHIFADTLASAKLNLDSLLQKVDGNKGLPEGFEKAAAIAYSAYPELRQVEIDMALTQYGAPMESTFDLPSLFLPWKKRKYLILLNDNRDSHFDPILLRALPFDAQVGILAHELGHVAYYDKLNVLQVAKWGLMYLFDDDFRATHERTTDLMPVYHGLGSQIYQYAYYVRKDSSCVSFYEAGKQFMDRYYMTDEELFQEVWPDQQLPSYGSN
jgi:hypothetical protein